MAATVVTVTEDPGGQLQAMLSHPDFRGGKVIGPIPLNPQGLPEPDTRQNVKAYGLQVREALGSHKGIQQALQTVLQLTDADGPTLYFNILARRAEDIRWETLCEGGSFVAIDGPCRIGRVASAEALESNDVRTATTPLRLTAYLSAAGQTSDAELASLLTQVTKARADGLPLECTIYLGEQALIDRTQTEIDAGRLSGVRVATIPPDSYQLEQALKREPSEFLHFFCHGIATEGVQYLELATVSDWDEERTDANGAAAGSVQLSAERLVSSPALKRAWVTVLNCCSGAAAVGDSNSMAYRLVAKGGAAAAVGLTEPIDSQDAPAISGPFYDSVFEQARGALEALKTSETASLNFSAAMGPVRQSLLARYSGNAPPELFGQWTLPVLYLSGRPLQVTLGTEAMRMRASTVAELLRNLPPSTPMELRQNMLSILDQPPKVADALRPNAYGLVETG